MYDFDEIGDSPICLGKDYDLDGKIALVQGFGQTEDDFLAKTLLQANVSLINNEKCAEMLRFNISGNRRQQGTIRTQLELGIVDEILCTVGLNEPFSDVYTVRNPKNQLKIESELNWKCL